MGQLLDSSRPGDHPSGHLVGAPGGAKRALRPRIRARPVPTDHADPGLVPTRALPVPTDRADPGLVPTRAGPVPTDHADPRPDGSLHRPQPECPRPHPISAAYSLRGIPDATVSASFTWSELDAITPHEFILATMPARFAELGDLREAIDDQHSRLQTLLEWAAQDESDTALQVPPPEQSDGGGSRAGSASKLPRAAPSASAPGTPRGQAVRPHYDDGLSPSRRSAPSRQDVK